MSYDVKCYNLAVEFLQDEPAAVATSAHIEELAQNIQDTIETLISSWAVCEICDEPAGEGGALCPACAANR
jgi:hypothetical protein